jgi:chorismate mutase
MMPQLGEVRGQINEIDRKIKPLLQQRMDCATQVALAKAQQARLAERAPVIFDGRREDEILSAVEAGEHTDSVKRLLQEIMGTSRRHQYRLLVTEGLLVDPFGGYLAGEKAVIPLQEGKTNAAMQVLSRYQIQLYRLDADSVELSAEEVLEMQALRVQLIAEGIAVNPKSI